MPAPTLRDLRESRGLSQASIGVHQVMASRFENGHTRPSAATMQKITAALSAVLPVSVPEVVAACRESQRRALVARGQMGKAHRSLSCRQRSGRAVRKAGRS